MKVFLRDDNPLSEVYLRYRDILEKSNKYDVIISSKDVNGEILETHKRILVIERLDGAAIWCRDLLKHPNVVTLLKMYHYPGLEENNRLAVGGRVFVPDDGSARPQSPSLDATDLAKVRPGFSFFHYKKIVPAIERARLGKCKPLSERGVMAFFAGTTEYDEGSPAGEWITRHRRGVVKTLERLAGAGHNVQAADRRAYTNTKYTQVLEDARLAPSPFGWGEFCYRDYEALLCGCVLLKPFLPRIVHLPDISGMWRPMSNIGEYFGGQVDWSEFKQYREDLIAAKDNERKIIERVLE